MILFVDTISNPGYIGLFDNNINLIKSDRINIKWNESSKLLVFIDDLIKFIELNYNDIKNIILVNWPGSFTWLRTSVLIINSINYLTKKNLTSINFFELFELSYNSYPIVKTSSKRDLFIKKTFDSFIEIIKNEDLEIYLKENNIKTLYWELSNSINHEFDIISKINYENIIKSIELDNLDKIEAFYVKKPSIS